MFSQPVVSVDTTKIFARATSDGRQFLVYQMNYVSSEENAMILPIPVRQPVREDSLRFINLKHYGDFFDDMLEGFPYSPPAFNIGCGGAGDDAQPLEVIEVGDFVASFVPQLSDFSRLDERFSLPESTWAQVPQYKDFGFAVFQLVAGTIKPHAMAFEFPTALDALFFPTLHIHDGEIHENEEFDHALYMQHAGFDSRVFGFKSALFPDSSTGLVRSKFPAGDFCDTDRANGIVDAELLVHRRLIQGLQPNSDTEIPTLGDPETPTLNLRPYMSYLPWLVIPAAVTWFLARRARVRRRKNS